MQWLNHLLGLHADRLTMLQMALRAVTVFFIAIFYVRVAGIRTFGRKTIFDQVTVLILGTLMGNAVFTPAAPFFSILLSALIIMLLHRFVAWATFKSDFLGKIIKGEPILLIKNGKIQIGNMKKSLITSHDLQESLHLKHQSIKLEDVNESYLERSGEISFINK